MVLYLKMDQNVWGQRDFTDSATYDCQEQYMMTTD